MSYPCVCGARQAFPLSWLLGEPVTRAEVLAELLEQGDVTSAAFFSSSGELLEALPDSPLETTLQGALKDF